MASIIRLTREDLLHPEECGSMTVRIEPALQCDWRHSEHLGFRNPSPHFHIVARGIEPNTSERVACLDFVPTQEPDSL